jgi:hypothetical protein
MHLAFNRPVPAVSHSQNDRRFLAKSDNTGTTSLHGGLGLAWTLPG